MKSSNYLFNGIIVDVRSYKSDETHFFVSYFYPTLIEISIYRLCSTTYFILIRVLEVLFSKAF
jgi:hypothetical protein